MKLIKQNNNWSCAACSFAMALDISLDQVFQRVGHDGSRKIMPDNETRYFRTGIHMQELVDVAIDLGYAATYIELFPMGQVHKNASPHKILFPQGNWDRFWYHLRNSSGVLECTTNQGLGHAVAYDRGWIYDPRGEKFMYDRQDCEQRGLYTNSLWRLDKCRK